MANTHAWDLHESSGPQIHTAEASEAVAATTTTFRPLSAVWLGESALTRAKRACRTEVALVDIINALFVTCTHKRCVRRAPVGVYVSVFVCVCVSMHAHSWTG